MSKVTKLIFVVFRL